jgi:DNA-directed RNA polymerase specialized sigma24 family protein
MSKFGITLDEIEGLCHQVAARYAPASELFWPSANQIFFFTLVWLQKRRVTLQHSGDRLGGEAGANLADHVRQVAEHLDEWGATVSLLKQREAKEWELLRIQMEKALRYYSCASDLKAEALQEALVKIWALLDKMANGRELEESEDLVALVKDKRAAWTNIYDFSSPFYAFAKRIARNELITQLRQQSAEPLYPVPWEEIDAKVPPIPPPLPEDETPSFDPRPLQLKVDLTKLMEIIQHYLTPKLRQVVCHTLAAQPQFWLALGITGLYPPNGFPPKSELTTDAEIGAVLGMTENNIRVHRAHAKKQMQELDPMLERLLETLMTRRGGNEKAKLG